MKELISTLLESKGIQVNERDFDFLEKQWSSLIKLKPAQDEAFLADFNIALCYIPEGGNGNE